jgi:hypothetical protein
MLKTKSKPDYWDETSMVHSGKFQRSFHPEKTTVLKVNRYQQPVWDIMRK